MRETQFIQSESKSFNIFILSSCKSLWKGLSKQFIHIKLKITRTWTPEGGEWRVWTHRSLWWEAKGNRRDRALDRPKGRENQSRDSEGRFRGHKRQCKTPAHKQRVKRRWMLSQKSQSICTWNVEWIYPDSTETASRNRADIASLVQTVKHRHRHLHLPPFKSQQPHLMPPTNK